MPITFEDIIQSSINLVREREELKLVNQQLVKRIKELEAELKCVREPDVKLPIKGKD
jgi:hypothetical protein